LLSVALDGSFAGNVVRFRYEARPRQHMKRVAVLGNTGGGKSMLAKRLAELTRLPLYPIDLIQFKAGGGRVPHDEYLKAHADLLRRDEWIIDGFDDQADFNKNSRPRWRAHSRSRSRVTSTRGYPHKNRGGRADPNGNRRVLRFVRKKNFAFVMGGTDGSVSTLMMLELMNL
jgi:hypothetical protein